MSSFSNLVDASNIVEFSGLSSDPNQPLREMARLRSQQNPLTPFVLFTDPVSFKGGQALMDLIGKLDLGQVWKSSVEFNPNSSRDLEIYVFAPNDKKLKAWYESEQERIKAEAAANHEKQKQSYIRTLQAAGYDEASIKQWLVNNYGFYG